MFARMSQNDQTALLKFGGLTQKVTTPAHSLCVGPYRFRQDGRRRERAGSGHRDEWARWPGRVWLL